MKLLKIYNQLYQNFGFQNWWPGDTQLEIIIGAILTQNTAWSNVEKAILNLKKNKLLNIKKLNEIKEKKLADIIRSSGYYNQKAKKIKSFIYFLIKEYNSSIKKMSYNEIYNLRSKLLDVFGIGKETADSILLYALNKKIFVIDAYTRRIFSRHNFFKATLEYDEIRMYFETRLPEDDIDLFKDYHAQIVMLGKYFCKKTPLCNTCPINKKTFFRKSL